MPTSGDTYPATLDELRRELARVTYNLRVVTDEAIERQSKLDQLGALCDEAERVQLDRTGGEFAAYPVMLTVEQVRGILGGEL